MIVDDFINLVDQQQKVKMNMSRKKQISAKFVKDRIRESYTAITNRIYGTNSKEEPKTTAITKYYSRPTPKVTFDSHEFTNEQLTRLQAWCTMKTNTILKKFKQLSEKDSRILVTDSYVFINNNAPVLAVGHLDVYWDHGLGYYYRKDDDKTNRQIAATYKRKDNIVFSPSLDDRLGTWLIWELLEKQIKMDVLFCLDEEIGKTTARIANQEKPWGEREYNWIFEFDRHGDTGVVMYQYDTPDLRKLMKQYDFDTQNGSFSDICALSSLKVSGFNFCTGYEDEHTQRCYANLDATYAQMKKFLVFYEGEKDHKLVHTPKNEINTSYYGGYWDYYNESYNCVLCGSYAEIWDSHGDPWCSACYTNSRKIKIEEDEADTDIDYRLKRLRFPSPAEQDYEDYLPYSDVESSIKLFYCDSCVSQFTTEKVLYKIKSNISSDVLFMCADCYQLSRTTGWLYECNSCEQPVNRESYDVKNQDMCYTCYYNSKSNYDKEG